MSAINSYWIFTTVHVTNEWSKSGIGFLVSDKKNRMGAERV